VTFGRHLRELRQRAGLSQTELAAASGLHHTAISQLERIRGRSMTLETLVRLAQGLGVQPGEIVDCYVASDDRPGR
jgi:transcriptional regulator with XRE-family HTH domain